MSDPEQWATDAVARLTHHLPSGYLLSPMPNETDLWIQEIVEAVLADPERLAPALHTRLTQRFPAGALGAFGRRAAALAVRTEAPHYIDLAVLALGFYFAGVGDARDAIVTLSLPWHSAQLLGVDPKPIYTRIASWPIGPGQKWLAEFAQRSPKDQTIEVMWFQESHDGDGFHYVRKASLTPEQTAQLKTFVQQLNDEDAKMSYREMGW